MNKFTILNLIDELEEMLRDDGYQDVNVAMETLKHLREAVEEV